MQRKPFARKIKYDQHAWFEKYRHLSKTEPLHVLLESGKGGRYSIIGLKPIAVLEGKNNVFSVTDKVQKLEKTGPIIDSMKAWMDEHQTEIDQDLPDFQGGAIGFFSYDCVRYVESLPDLAADDLKTPDLYFLIFEDVVIFDHEERVLWLITHDHISNEREASKRLDLFEQLWTENGDDDGERSICNDDHHGHHSLSHSEASFIHAVERVKDYIAAGDVFQVNLSVRQTMPLHTPPLNIYQKLRKLNPSPYMAYMQTPDFQVVCGSPELLIKKKGTRLSTRPIAGTRSRGKSDSDDQRLAKELMTNEKERAEHVMLVDLERNDLGRVCKYGSVEVNEFMVIEKYSHVMHIVSNIQGEIAPGHDTFSAIKAVFPGGTITGAPKVRTLEIIEELEPIRRGIYTGSIGWIGFNGDMELNIVIRTMFVQGGEAHVQAGAGIVIDSDPQAEYKEAIKKAQALIAAKVESELDFAKKSMS